MQAWFFQDVVNRMYDAVFCTKHAAVSMKFSACVIRFYKEWGKILHGIG